MITLFLYYIWKFFNHVGEHNTEQSMKELQSQMTCLCILHYHVQQKTLILSY